MYSFRKITPADEAMFKHWIIHPHIGGWWKDGDTEWGLVAEDIDSPHIDMRTAQADGHPIGFIQDYNAHHWGMPQYAVFPPDTRAIRAYEKAGFRPDKIIACEDGDPVHVMVYP